MELNDLLNKIRELGYTYQLQPNTLRIWVKNKPMTAEKFVGTPISNAKAAVEYISQIK
jgi:hypothetical protein